MKYILSGLIAASVSVGVAQAQSSIFTGDYSVSAEIGAAFALDRSDRSLIIANNTSPGAFPGSTLVEFLDTSALDYGVGFSGELEFKAGLTFGGKAFVRADGMFATGENELNFEGGAGAFPGSHDDGFLVNDAFDNVATVDSRAVSLTIGYERPFANGFTGSVGLMYAGVSQNLEVNNSFGLVSGEGENQMGGLLIGAGYERAINQSWSVALIGNAAILANTYDYNYLKLDTGGGVDQEVDNTGTSTVIRLDAKAKVIYNFRPATRLTGTIGLTNYSGVSTGLDNMLNEENTATVINDSITDVTFRYARVGIEFTF